MSIIGNILYPLSIGLMATCGKKEYKDQIIACLKTWVTIATQHGIPVCILCDTTIDDDVEELINQNELTSIIHFDLESDYNSAFYKHIWGYKHLHENYTSKYYLIGGTDNYFNINRILKLLPKYNYMDEFIISGMSDIRSDIFAMVFPDGKSGIIKTYGATIKIYNKLDWLVDTWEKLTNVDRFKYLKPACDVSMGYIAHYLGIAIVCEKYMYYNDWLYNNYVYNWNPSFLSDILPLGKGNDIHEYYSYHYMSPMEMYLCHKYLDIPRYELVNLLHIGKGLLFNNKTVLQYLDDTAIKYNIYYINYQVSNAYLHCIIYDIIHNAMYKHYIDKNHITNIYIEKTDSNYLENIINNIIQELNLYFIKLNTINADTSIEYAYIENKNEHALINSLSNLNIDKLESFGLISHGNTIEYPTNICIGDAEYICKQYNQIYSYTKK